jgi:hypothetical protein
MTGVKGRLVARPARLTRCTVMPLAPAWPHGEVGPRWPRHRWQAANAARQRSWGRLLGLDGVALVRDFADGMMLADARAPTWASYRAGLGPHTEVQVVALVMAELACTHPTKYGAFQTGVPIQTLRARSATLLFHQARVGHGRLK